MPSNYSHPHLTGNDKGLYATMRGGRIDPSSCLDTCWVDDMAVWWFRATCFHGLKYLCVNREVLKDNCIIHMVDGKRYTQSCPMGDIEPELNPNMFKRIHRSFIVNIRYIDMYYYGHVVMVNGMEVHIGDKYRDALKSSFHFWGSRNRNK